MKAAVFYECGGPEVIQVVDLPVPSIEPDQVLLRVRAAALNHLDLWTLAGPPDPAFQLPHCGGADMAGVVAEVGSRVTTAAPGDRVLVNPNLSCGLCEQCLGGQESLCPDYDILTGGFAEYAAVAADKLLRLPDELPYAEAAAVPLVFQTAWRAVVAQGQVRPGEDVLVLGASGGVASAAIQIARLAGARVVAVTSSREKVDRARQLGADEVFNRSEGDYWAEVARWTGGRGLDLVVEGAGAATWASCLESLAKGGRLVTYGRTTGRIAETNVSLVFWNQLRIIGTTMSSDREFREVMSLVFQGRLRPVIDSVFPLAEAGAAYARLQSGQHFGKVVIEIGE